jgi:hypothetical protein
MKPETPPIFGSPENPRIRFTRPCLPGVVPTSKSTQNSGLRKRQNPSKNHKWEESLVPLVCLKHENNLRPYFESDGFFRPESGK